MAKEKTNDLVHIGFSNKQIFHQRKITSDGKKVSLVSVSLPSSAEHKGYYIDIAAERIHPSKNGERMSYVSYKKQDREGNPRQVPIYRYDKTTDKKEQVLLSVDELKAEFNSWRNKDKEQSNSYEQPAPSYASADNSDFEEFIDNDDNDNLDDISL